MGSFYKTEFEISAGLGQLGSLELFLVAFKGQLISKGLFKVFIHTKKRTNIFCISDLANQKIRALFITNWRILS